jgi:fanconi anemia group D2 protein
MISNLSRWLGQVQIKSWLKVQIKEERLDTVAAVVQELQGGTRILQTACMEAKARRMGAVTKLVPSVKRSLEQFVQNVRVLLKESSTLAGVWVGNLKHKNLQGEVMNETLESQSDTATVEDDEQGGTGELMGSEHVCND